MNTSTGLRIVIGFIRFGYEVGFLIGWIGGGPNKHRAVCHVNRVPPGALKSPFYVLYFKAFQKKILVSHGQDCMKIILIQTAIVKSFHSAVDPRCAPHVEGACYFLSFLLYAKTIVA